MRTKIYSTLILLLLFNTLSIAQNNNEDNIYFKALKEYARYVERFEPETDTVYFEVLKGVTSLFPKEINNIKVIILTALNQQKIYEANDGKLVHRKMSPAQVIEDKIDISIIPFQGQYSVEGGGLRLGLSKWHSIIFVYDTDTKSFKYSEM